MNWMKLNGSRRRLARDGTQFHFAAHEFSDERTEVDLIRIHIFCGPWSGHFHHKYFVNPWNKLGSRLVAHSQADVQSAMRSIDFLQYETD